MQEKLENYSFLYYSMDDVFGKKKKRKKSGQNENSSSETEKKQKMSAQNCENFNVSNQLPSQPTGTDHSIGRIKGGLILENISILNKMCP